MALAPKRLLLVSLPTLPAALAGAAGRMYATITVSAASGEADGACSPSSSSSSSRASPSSPSSFGMGIWARVAALATQGRASPVAVDIGCGQHAATLAQLGMRVVGNPFLTQAASSPATPQPSMQRPQSVDLVLAASMARQDIGPRLAQAYSLLRADGHLVACWNDRDLYHPLTKALLKARSSTPLKPSPTPATSPPSPLATLQAAAAGAGACSSATAASAVTSSSCTAALPPVRGVSTHACAAAFLQAGHADEEQHEYNATRHLLEGVVGVHGRSLFRVVSFSILPNPLPLSAPLPDALSALVPDASLGAGPLVLPFETKMFILRKAS